MRFTALCAGLGLALAAATAAEAAPVAIAGGETVVGVTAPLGDLGLGVGLIGDAEPAGDKVLFPITGGTIDGADAIIEHDGSGVRLFALADEDVFVDVGDFVIDTGALQLSGAVFDSSSFALNKAVEGVQPIPFFDIGLSGDESHPFSLTITGDLDYALGLVFGDGENPLGLAGSEFGVASTAPAPVPLPGAAPLLLGGLAALGVIRRRRSAA